MSVLPQLKNLLNKYWGFDEFRPNQIPIIESIVSGTDTLAVLPTGGGKSICFQIPALYFDGLTVVISPLIALMTDQTSRLKKLNISAEALHSGLDSSQQSEILNQALEGQLKLLYLSPERLFSKKFNTLLPKIPLSLLVIDEAHCISQFGHDFRPSYRRLSTIREVFSDVPILALTATATTAVIQDLVSNLKLQKPKLVIHSSKRINLKYKVIFTEDKRGSLLRFVISHHNQTGILYARNRKLVAELSLFLKQRGINSAYYHAGLSSSTKNMVLEKWLDNEIQLVVATNAFGMGIDKSDVRYVIHYDLPPTLEDYIQEAGRGGRDGKKAEAIILVDKSDFDNKLVDIEKKYPSRAYIQKVYRSISTYLGLSIGEKMREPVSFGFIDFCSQFKLNPLITYHSIDRLEKANLLFLTQGFHSPSLLQIESKFVNQMDDLNISASTQLVVKSCVRIYDGIFYKKCKIDTAFLAKHCKIDKVKIDQILNRLSVAKWVDYTPQTDLPKLKIMGPRRDSSQITIPAEILEDRKESAIKRLYKMNEYLLSKQCRQVVMGQYFGEEGTTDCGLCDNCQSLNTSSEKSDLKYLIEKIKFLLAPNNLNLIDLLNEFPADERSQIVEILQLMESENIVTIVNELIILNR